MPTILIVDDEINFIQLLDLVLRRHGYNIIHATSGKEALALARTQCPDLIILDDMMPGLSGGDVCVTIKTDAALHHIPVILHSAGTWAKDPEYIKQIGADDVILKPSSSRDIVAKVAHHVRTVA